MNVHLAAELPDRGITGPQGLKRGPAHVTFTAVQSSQRHEQNWILKLDVDSCFRVSPSCDFDHSRNGALECPRDAVNGREYICFRRYCGGSFNWSCPDVAGQAAGILVDRTNDGRRARFGVINHFVLSSPDHVAHVDPQFRSLFTTTAVLLAVTEALCVGLDVHALRGRRLG
jgi:hypothetical protein